MTVDDPRLRAAQALDRALDPEILDALCHPARLALVRRLILTGEADIGLLSRDFPQDRSVMSRHLARLERAGLAISRRSGRRVFYQLDAVSLLGWLETVQGAANSLAELCCPETKDQTNDPDQIRPTGRD